MNGEHEEEAKLPTLRNNPSNIFRFIGLSVLCSTIVWVLLWMYADVLHDFAMILLVPIYCIALILSLFLFRWRQLSVVPIFLIMAPVTGLSLTHITEAACKLYGFSYTYELGVEVQTPSGPISSTNMIEVVNQKNPFKALKRFTEIGIQLSGGAVHLDLNDGRALLLMLDFDSRTTCDFVLLPWIAARKNVSIMQRSLPRIEGRIPLHGDLRPILLYFSDFDDPYTATVCTQEDADELLGEGYSLISVWAELVEKDFDIGDIRESVTWYLKIQNQSHELTKLFSSYSVSPIASGIIMIKKSCGKSLHQF